MAAFALWITGLPGSGKSTMAEEVRKRHPDFVILRMDELRKIITPEPTYSEEERDMAYRCIVYTAACLVENDHSVVIDATGNLRRWRDLARQLIPKYGEVYLKCPIEVCKLRERERNETHGAPRDVYSKAETGWPVPGVAAPYEEPVNPELLIEVDRTFIPVAVQKIEDLIRTLQGD